MSDTEPDMAGMWLTRSPTWSRTVSIVRVGVDGGDDEGDDKDDDEDDASQNSFIDDRAEDELSVSEEP